MIRTQCVRCGLPAEVDHPEDVLNTRCTACSGKLAAVWGPPEAPHPLPPLRRGRFQRDELDPERASYPRSLG